MNGPPVHDPLCVAYLTHPELFKGKRYRVDVELAGTFTAGTTSVDLWDYRLADLTAFAEDPSSRESWGRFGKNVWVAEEVDVSFLPISHHPLHVSHAVLMPVTCRLRAFGACSRRRWTRLIWCLRLTSSQFDRTQPQFGILGGENKGRVRF